MLRDRVHDLILIRLLVLLIFHFLLRRSAAKRDKNDEESNHRPELQPREREDDVRQHIDSEMCACIR